MVPQLRFVLGVRVGSVKLAISKHIARYIWEIGEEVSFEIEH